MVASLLVILMELQDRKYGYASYGYHRSISQHIPAALRPLQARLLQISLHKLEIMPLNRPFQFSLAYIPAPSSATHPTTGICRHHLRDTTHHLKR